MPDPRAPPTLWSEPHEPGGTPEAPERAPVHTWGIRAPGVAQRGLGHLTTSQPLVMVHTVAPGHWDQGLDPWC